MDHVLHASPGTSLSCFCSSAETFAKAIQNLSGIDRCPSSTMKVDLPDDHIPGQLVRLFPLSSTSTVTVPRISLIVDQPSDIVGQLICVTEMRDSIECKLLDWVLTFDGLSTVVSRGSLSNEAGSAEEMAWAALQVAPPLTSCDNWPRWIAVSEMKSPKWNFQFNNQFLLFHFCGCPSDRL